MSLASFLFCGALALSIVAFCLVSANSNNDKANEAFLSKGQSIVQNVASLPRGSQRRTKRSDDIIPLSDVVQAQAAAVQALQAEVAVLRGEVAALRQKAGLAGAFSVRFTNDPITNVGVHGTLKFDSVVFNHGNFYNPGTGIFTAPTAGLYVFFVSMMGSDNAGAIDVAVVKSGQAMDIAWAEGQGDLYDQGSCLVTTHMAVGEQVWVQHWDGATAFRGGSLTTFSGFLLHADL